MATKYDIEWLEYENSIINNIDKDLIKNKIIFYDKNMPFTINYCTTEIILNIIRYNDNIEFIYWKDDHLRCLFKHVKITPEIINFLIKKNININFLSKNEHLNYEMVKDIIHKLDISQVLCNSNITIDELSNISKLEIDCSKLQTIKNKFIEKKKEKDLIKNINDVKNITNKYIQIENKLESLYSYLDNNTKKISKLETLYDYIDTTISSQYEIVEEIKDKFDTLKLIQVDINNLHEDMNNFQETINNFKEDMNTFKEAINKIENKNKLIINNIKYNNTNIIYELNKNDYHKCYIIGFMLIIFGIQIYIVYNLLNFQFNII